MTRPLEKLALELRNTKSPMDLMGLFPDLGAGFYDLTQRLEKLEREVAALIKERDAAAALAAKKGP